MMHLHSQIMNLQTPAHVENYSNDARTCYKEGHRLARHGAAELALKADAVSEAASALLAHLDRINCLTREEEPYLEALRVALEA